ncbi:GGDEF domain-containing protein [Actinocrispum sp. NPDC049592]|uniref:sensor domain-containing diguanylate cyclase n=1 Tax=Actinocrispum sp. NPDC049592 TaxID=3154835 RepID=UPI0034269318
MRGGVRIRPGRLALLDAPKGVLPYYVGTEIAAIAIVLATTWCSVSGQEWIWFGLLSATGVAQAELSMRVEKIRSRLANAWHVNMTSVWLFAGALLLPPLLAVILALTIYGHLWVRVWRPERGRPAYRKVFSTTTIVLSCLAVRPVLDWLGVSAMTDAHLPVIVLAGAAYTFVNSALVMIGVRLHHPDEPLLPLTGSWADNILELATLCLGGVTAVVLSTSPTLAVLMVLPVVVLHRCLLMRQLEELVTKDQKTGLLTSAEWHNRAASELTRARRGGILMIDLDHFSLINRRHGHVAGDVALKAVADTISAEVRTYDPVGRFGGEEFVVLLPGTHEEHSVAVAERIREKVAGLEVPAPTTDGSATIKGLSVSIGVATFEEAGAGVEGLLVAADRALYRAKDDGRNQVVVC